MRSNVSGVGLLRPLSHTVIVVEPTPARSDSSRSFILSTARAALHCDTLIFVKVIPHSPWQCVHLSPSMHDRDMIGARHEKQVKRGRSRRNCYRHNCTRTCSRKEQLGEALAPMPEEPEKPINLLWALDEVVIALQQIRERLRRMAQADAPPRKPGKTRS